jgi:hypothetical protein
MRLKQLWTQGLHLQWANSKFSIITTTKFCTNNIKFRNNNGNFSNNSSKFRKAESEILINNRSNTGNND